MCQQWVKLWPHWPFQIGWVRFEFGPDPNSYLVDTTCERMLISQQFYRLLRSKLWLALCIIDGDVYLFGSVYSGPLYILENDTQIIPSHTKSIQQIARFQKFHKYIGIHHLFCNNIDKPTTEILKKISQQSQPCHFCLLSSSSCLCNYVPF